MTAGEPVPASPRRTMRYRGAAGAGPDLRQALLDAARRLLESRRLDELTVVDLIKEAGVSRATFYMYFESKHDVVAALADDVIIQVLDDVWRPWLSGAEPAKPEILLDHMERTITLWHDHRTVLVAAAEGWRTHPSAYEGWAEIMRRYIADTRVYIERAREGGAASGLDPEVLATVLVWGNENAVYLTFTGQAPELAGDEDRLATTLARVWWCAIYGSGWPG